MYNAGKSLPEVLEAFILEALRPDEEQTKNAIRTRIKASHGFEIQNAQIAQVLVSLRNRGIVATKGDRFWLAEGQQAYQDLKLKISEIDRETAALTKDAISFFKEQKVDITKTEFQELLDALLRENMRDVIATLEPGQELPEAKHIQDAKKRLLLSYLAETEKSNPTQLATIEKLVAGAMLSVLLRRTETPSGEVLTPAQKHLEFFLDTNFVIHLLGLNGKECQAAAKEVHELLKANNYTLRVFDFTISELSRLLNNYSLAEDKYTAQVPVDHVYYHMKAKGWTPAHVLDFLAELDTILGTLGIAQEPTGILLDHYEAANVPEAQRLDGYGISRSEHAKKHDIAAIEGIRARRGSRPRRFSSSKVFFLTTDTGLAQFNLVEAGHQSESTIVEVILDATLANILWMKKPDLKISLKVLIAANVQNGLISNKLWLSVRKQMLQQHKDGQISDDQFEALLYSGFLASSLAGYNAAEEMQNADFETLVEKAEKQKVERNKGLEKDIRERERAAAKAEVQRMAENQIAELGDQAKKAQEERKAALAKVDEQNARMRANIAKKALKAASRYTMFYRTSASIAGGLLLLLLLAVAPDQFQVILAIGSFAVAAGGWSLKPVWKRLHDYFKIKFNREITEEITGSGP